MNCKRCGNPLAPGSVFCPNCGTKNEPVANPYPNPAPTRAAAPTPAAPTYAAPTPAAPTAAAPTYAAPAYPGYAAPAPKKSKKKLFLIIGAAVACVAVIALVLILVLGGGTPGTPETPKASKTPGQAAEQLANAMEKGDIEAACRVAGVDYRKYVEKTVTEWFEDYYDEDIDDLRDAITAYYGVKKEWKNRAKNINSLNDAITFMADYWKAQWAERAEDDYFKFNIKDLRNADIDELTGSDRKKVIKNLKSWYEDDEDCLLFDLDDIDEVYHCGIDGYTRYIVKTSKGCFFISFIGYIF